MHLLRIESRSFDGTSEAVDLGQTPAEIVALSFTDTDLSVLAAAWESAAGSLPGLRLANLTALRHPYSVDLYVEKVLSKARFVLVRLLGGKDYWRYGVDELAALARDRGIHLAIVPGDGREDARLDEASTLPPTALRRIQRYFAAGGVTNIGACLRFVAAVAAGADTTARAMAPPRRHGPARPGHLSPRDVGAGDPSAPGHDDIPPFDLFVPASRTAAPGSPLALIVLYRAWVLAADTDPVVAQADALARRGFRVVGVHVGSLKDPDAAAALRVWLATERPDVILNMTAFSARVDGAGSVLDAADAPVFQVALSGGGHQQWVDSPRGLGPADLAMNIVLPEFDGRIIAGAISFKRETSRNAALEFTRLTHHPEPTGIAHAADLALGWARLRRTPRPERRLACVLSDYPAKSGRTGYAVGLDTPRSVVAIADRLAVEGFAVRAIPDAATLIATLAEGGSRAVLSLTDYQRQLATLPPRFVAAVREAWGAPEHDAAAREPESGHDRDGNNENQTEGPAFHFRFVRAGNLLIAVQPDRGAASARKAEYHDPNLPPRHAYIAFYLWLRMVERVHAIIHCGTHGTLEWLPGKAVALSDTCAPRVVLGPVPLIYPFIVNNPGEAAQAKRRTAAVTIGHLTPPLMAAGTHGATIELEGLFDEYAEAQSLDPRRATRLAELIMVRARETGLAAESGISPEVDAQEALLKLDAWLCNLKDLRIGDGLHVFGEVPETARRAEATRSLAAPGSTDAATVDRLIGACAEAEMDGLLAALDGRFVPPGPAGAPDRGRLDVLPTGRNLYSVDPRSVPTRTAWEIGRRTAEAMLTRHAQDHGEWPRVVVLDIWGSATMRTGGDDLAQALALLGVRPRWDAGSGRVAGFDIMPLAVLNRPRVDVTLRMSGLFRDVFPAQIALFAEVVREVAALDEAPEDNPLAASIRDGSDAGQRIFGAAPGAYGTGLSRALAEGAWTDRTALGETYLRATSHAYGVNGDGVPAAPAFRGRVARADAYVHVQDLAGQDVLGADAFAEHGGGFAAAAAALGNHPALYQADTTDPERARVRTLREAVALVLRARATNPRWLAGQLRHGFRGAAEIAETVDHFFAYAALTDMTTDAQFDLLFDATLGDEAIRIFLTRENPGAAKAIAERFDEAVRRGLWRSRRNSAGAIVAGVRAETR
jgi:cobaltochelatase CobN